MSYNLKVKNGSQTKINDYSKFGSVMVGREFEADTADRYRFGFNGKEKTDEIYGEGNGVDFGARIYDSRLGRWLALDPLAEKYPRLSPYSSFANNPVIFIDPDGRVLTLGGQLNVAENDIKSLIQKPEYRNVLKITTEILKDGTSISHVDFNMKAVPTLTQEEINSDPGLRLIQRLTSSSEEYLYEVTKQTEVTVELPKTTSSAQENTTYTTSKRDTEKKVDNIMSQTPLYYNDATAKPTETPKKHHDDSKGCYDGQVALHPEMIAQIKKGSIYKDLPRESIVFHALSEVYYRSEDLNEKNKKSGAPYTWGMPYASNDNTRVGGAHNESLKDEFGESGMKKFYKSGSKVIDGWRTATKKFDGRGKPR